MYMEGKQVETGVILTLQTHHVVHTVGPYNRMPLLVTVHLISWKKKKGKTIIS